MEHVHEICHTWYLFQMEAEEEEGGSEEVVAGMPKRGRRWGLPSFKRKEKPKGKADSVVSPIGKLLSPPHVNAVVSLSSPVSQQIQHEETPPCVMITFNRMENNVMV